MAARQAPSAEAPIDPVNIQPTDAEIEAAAREEAAAAQAAEEQKAATPKKGPGRPPGSKNRATKEKEARASATRTRTTVAKPDVPPADTPNPAREAAKLRAENRKRRTAELTAEIKEMRPEVAKTLAMVSSLPVQFFVQPEVTDNGQPVINGDTGEPIETLTPYGMMIVPSEGQIKAVARAVARAEESEIGAQLAERFEKFAPAFFMLVGAGAVVAYTVTAFGTLQALKPQIAEEIARMATEQGADTPSPRCGSVTSHVPNR